MDPLVPFEQRGRVIIERIPNAKGVVLEGGEHTAIFTHRDEAKTQTAAFLREHAATLSQSL